MVLRQVCSTSWASQEQPTSSSCTNKLNKPFIVGLTYVDATSQGQALKTLQLKVRDTNGNVQERTIVPTVDPYQQQTDILGIRQSWRWDGFTSIAVDLNASALRPSTSTHPKTSTSLAASRVSQSLAATATPMWCAKTRLFSVRVSRMHFSRVNLTINKTEKAGKFFPRLFLFL